MDIEKLKRANEERLRKFPHTSTVPNEVYDEVRSILAKFPKETTLLKTAFANIKMLYEKVGKLPSLAEEWKFELVSTPDPECDPSELFNHRFVHPYLYTDGLCVYILDFEKKIITQRCTETFYITCNTMERVENISEKIVITPNIVKVTDTEIEQFAACVQKGTGRSIFVSQQPDWKIQPQFTAIFQDLFISTGVLKPFTDQIPYVTKTTARNKQSITLHGEQSDFIKTTRLCEYIQAQINQTEDVVARMEQRLLNKIEREFKFSFDKALEELFSNFYKAVSLRNSSREDESIFLTLQFEYPSRGDNYTLDTHSNTEAVFVLMSRISLKGSLGSVPDIKSQENYSEHMFNISSPILWRIPITKEQSDVLYDNEFRVQKYALINLPTIYSWGIASSEFTQQLLNIIVPYIEYAQLKILSTPKVFPGQIVFCIKNPIIDGD